MHVEKLIQAAKICTSPDGKCADCQMQKNSRCVIKTSLMASEICAISNHYEALLKAERSKVIAEVREWAIENACGTPVGNRLMAMLYSMELDSMEPDKEEPNVPAD